MTARKEKRHIPEFESREQEAEFWDTHDISDYASELKPARVRFAKRLSEGITIRLTPELLSSLRACAGERGVGPTTLARMWILERLKEEEDCGAAGHNHA